MRNSKGQFIKGIIPWNKGLPMSDKTKKKVSDACKGNKSHFGFKHSEKAREKIRIAHLGMKHSEKTKRKMSNSRKGEKHHAWKGGERKCLDCGKKLNTHYTKRCQKCYGISKRGKNVFALYSAFTNYASYADERNGFTLRNTGKDTVAQSMWAREQKVSQWISSPQFKSLMAA